MDTLGTIPLHPALVAASGATQQASLEQGGEGDGGESGTGGGDEGGGGKTLLDCIPVEREQRLLESCRTSQRRFRLEGDNVAQKYSAIEQVRKDGDEKQRRAPEGWMPFGTMNRFSAGSKIGTPRKWGCQCPLPGSSDRLAVYQYLFIKDESRYTS